MISLAGKLFPSYVSYVENHKTLVEVRVTELKAIDQFPPSAFASPEGATSSPGCMNPVPSRIVKKIQPHYPEQDRQNRAEGTVGLFGLILKDGSLKGLRVVSGVTSGLNDASMAAVRQWRYEPATCNGNPIESETVITVHYLLQAD
jgi:TonB family protein